MRIVSEWTTDDIRVTIFHMNGRYSIKLEKDLLEQVYKFRDGQFDSLEQIKEYTDESFYSRCQSIFNTMKENQSSGMKQDPEIEFDEII